jgi:hypothetical protein
MVEQRWTSYPDAKCILADYAEALGLKPRSKPITYAQAKKLVDKLYTRRHGKIRKR